MKKEWGEEPDSEYAVFSWIVKPYIKKLYENGNCQELERVWNCLEHIASEWGDPARNEIFVVIAEEIELNKHYKYLGPTLLEHWKVSITWFPEYNDHRSPINRHIDKNAYRARWLEEIDNIGGFGNLTSSKESEIFRNLKSEFKFQSYATT